MTTPKLPVAPLINVSGLGQLRPACDLCGLRPFGRNRWFDGKLVMTRDLEDEQDYLRGKGRLHNSLAHGIGTVCGLKVTEHPNAACQHQYVVLNPGLAYDCCGHEIIVHERKVIDLRARIESALRARQRFNDGRPGAPNIYVRLAYRESEDEPVPALLDDCGCDTHPVEYSRTRECYELLVDLEEPAHAVSEPLDARLEWRNTLSVSAPVAILVDRVLQRLYVAEWDGRGWLRTYDTEHHTMLSRAPLGELKPTALACSSAGDLLYIAGARSDNAEIAIIHQQQLENGPVKAERAIPIPDQSVIVSLEIALRDDALLAVLADGRILRWANDTLRAWIEKEGEHPPPKPNSRDLRALLKEVITGPEITGPQQPLPREFVPAGTTQSVGQGGYWLVVADKNRPRLVVLNLAQFIEPNDKNFIKSFPLPTGDIARAVEFSGDGKYLYVLCSQTQMLYRLDVRDRLDTFIPSIPNEREAFSALPLCDPDHPGGQNPPPRPEFRDLSIAPRDSWAYLLCTDPAAPQERGQVMIVSTEGMGANTGMIDAKIAATLRKIATSTLGAARCQTLAFSGQRLYVAGDTIPASGEPTAGSVSIIDIEEDACCAHITRTIDGCCPTSVGEDGVIIASIRGYQWNRPMVDHEPVTDTNYIDNYTYRSVAPSTNTLHQMIECILKKGISEGVPGPRGPQGAEGKHGDPGAQGPKGDAGPRGAGINQVVVESLDAGKNATAELEPILAGGVKGDWRLKLGIPQGKPGEAPKPQEFNQIIAASWHHDEVMTKADFIDRVRGVGLVIVFKRPVRVETLTERSFFMRLRRPDKTYNLWDCESELTYHADVTPVKDPKITKKSVMWLTGPVKSHSNPRQYATERMFNLVTSVKPFQEEPPQEPPDLVSAVQLMLPQQVTTAKQLADLTQLELVVRGDWVIDDRGCALDGHAIWPGVPEQPSGNGNGGGDWISLIHFAKEQG
jgi:hypothetical protein